MDELIRQTETHDKTDNSTLNIGERFLAALFEDGDTILFRPIETWEEEGKKRSRVISQSVHYLTIERDSIRSTLQTMWVVSESEKANIFFGVCPRIGDCGHFDLAWQIRTVRTLWSDIDHVTVDEVRERLDKAGMLLPSIVVNSGNGVHLYWLLDEPYAIDDADDPLPVKTEWIKTPNGRSKSRKYFLEDGERVYLDQRRYTTRLSPKAEHLQDILSGITRTCGGDHTTDLSRLLRLPGTQNRKNERNHCEPKPTALIDCDPSRRYSLTEFESLASPSRSTERARQIKNMPLPRPRKISHSRADQLDRLIAACLIAPEGSRSESDFALCCYAIKSSVEKEYVWGLVENIGKFAEQGRRYFDLTWANAEYEVRSGLHDRLMEAMPSNRESTIVKKFPFLETDGNHPTILIDSQIMPIAETLQQVTDSMLKAGNCFNRAEQLVVINDQAIIPILSWCELAGFLNQHVEFFFVKDDAGDYKPLPTAYGTTWLNQWIERRRLPTIALFTRNPVFTKEWRLVEPGFDPQSGIYYAGSAIEVRDGTRCLDTLLQDFCFKATADRTNYIGMLLTAILLPHFIGSKPAALFNGNQPRLGKSILSQIIAILRDGRLTETATYNPNDEEFEKRLGAMIRRGVTTIIVDNAKARNRNPRIESACLERSITDPILSFRLLGHSQEIRAENSHIFCITANTPDVSRDLVTRSVVINLYHEGAPDRRKFSIDDPEEFTLEHRSELLGELIGMVERWKASGMPKATVNSRFNKRDWGPIVGGILEFCGELDFLANAEEAAAQLDETRREFSELVGVLSEHPQGTWTASELIEICNRHKLLSGDLGDGSPRSLATKMGILAGRYIDDPFPLADERYAVFHKSPQRKGAVYRIEIRDEVPNLQGSAEPLSNLKKPKGSAH